MWGTHLCTALLISSPPCHNRTRARVSSFCRALHLPDGGCLGGPSSPGQYTVARKTMGCMFPQCAPLGCAPIVGVCTQAVLVNLAYPLHPTISSRHTLLRLLHYRINHSTLPLLRAHIAHIAPARGHSTALFAIPWGRTAGYRTATFLSFLFFC